jgi:prolyl 4-hydroxylase
VKVYFLSQSQGVKASNQEGLNNFAPDGNFGSAFPNYLTLVNTYYPISLACTAPRILHVLDVISPEECDAIVEASRPSLTPSTVVSNTETNSAVAKDVRSSFGTYFPRGSHPVVKVVEGRIAELFRFPLSHAEPIQILNYAPNAEYKPHHDYFDENTVEGQRIVSRSGNRVATLIMYLNEVERGGATIFPKLNLQVLPRKGSVLYFDYFLPGGIYDPDSLHGGTPVLAGEKWIATQWVRRLPYEG